MNIRLWSGTCAAIAFGLAVSLFAQTPPASQSSYANAKTITVTGCVERAEKLATGTAGTTGIAGSTGVEEPKFVLTNVVSSSSETAGTAGTTEAKPSIASKYRLDADDAKLEDHVGHKVEITGTVTPQPAASSTAEPSTAQPPSSSSSSASSEKPPKLKVDTVKMIASTCP